jgi:RNA polymerase sigma-70 factor (ECF subfamily)
MESEPTDRTERLLEHAGWLRALARRLVKDDATADDLVQETWTAALTHPPDHAGRPWLSRVVRNLARQRFRGEGRRLRRERSAAKHEELPSSEELAERLEVERLVVEAVQALPEPYRSTVVLRFYEGLSAAEIARRKDLPAATVRSHLKRGLDEVRRRLDAAHGGSRRAWSAVLLPGLFPRSAGPLGALSLATLTRGVLTMSMAAKLGVVACVAAVTIVGYELTRPDAELTPPEGVVGLAPADPARPRDPADAPALPEAGGRARSVLAAPARPGSDPAGAATRPEAEPVLPVISAHIVDEEDRPIEDAELTLGGGFHVPAGHELPSARSDATGRVRLELEDLEAADRLAILARAEGYVGQTLIEDVPPGGRDLGDIVLARGARLSGRVVDHEDLPVAGARVLARSLMMMHRDLDTQRRGGPYINMGTGPFPETVSEVDGTFALDGVRPGDVRVWARTPETLWSVAPFIGVAAGDEREEIVIRLEPLDVDDAIRGVVRAPDGAPVVGAIVHSTFDGPNGNLARWAISDEEGAFHFIAIGPASHTVRAGDPEGRWPAVETGGLHGGDRVDLCFAATRTLRVRVLDQDGELLPGARVAFVNVETGGEMGGLAALEGEPGLLAAIEPAEPYRLRARASGHTSEESGPHAPGALADEHPIVLAALPDLAGRVLRSGDGVGGARVTLHTVLEPEMVMAHRGFFSRVRPFDAQTTRTSPDGGFAFTVREPGDYLLRAELEGAAPTDLLVEGYVPEEGRRDADLSFRPGGAIEGRVLGAPDGNPAGTFVGVSRGDGHPQLVEVDAQGTFRFEDLTPGPWDVEAFHEEPDTFGSMYRDEGAEPVEFRTVCEVSPGETTYHDVDLAARPTCTVRGRIEVDGAPAGSWIVQLRTARSRGRSGDSAFVLANATGGFSISIPVEGPAILTLRPHGGGDVGLSYRLDLVRGETEHEVAFETGRVVLENVPAASSLQETAFLVWEGPDGAKASERLEPDAAGRHVLAGVPAGTVRVVRYPDSEVMWAPGEPTVLLTIDVPAGGEVTARLP